MIWVDREVKKIKERKLPVEWVDDMKTPSGRVHVGALRGVVIHDLLHKVLKENGVKTSYTYVFNDMDQMDAIPSYLDSAVYDQYSGVPLCNIPSPEKGFKSLADYFAQEFISVFSAINCHPTIIWGSEYYKSGKMNDVIKIALDKADKVRDVYRKVSKSKRADDWLPFQAVCEKCGKVGTTYAYKWDGTLVYYRCVPDMAKWAKGCGHEGAISPYNGNGKLHWKVDWPALWKVIGVTVEGSGKDHMASGGSFDVAVALCNEVLDYPAPYAVAYEWFTVGGKKMSSSKGIGSSAKEVSTILPPDIFKFFIVRTPIETHLDFNPFGDTIPNIFDEYDTCMNAYFDKLEGKIPEGKPGEVIADFARIIELSQVRTLPATRLFLPRFRRVANILKTTTNPATFFAEQKGSALTAEELAILEERVRYAKLYLEKYAAEDEKITFRTELPEGLELTDNQRTFVTALVAALKNLQPADRDGVQQVMFDVLKKNGFKPKEVFPAFYRTLIGRDFGPKAGDLIIEHGINKTIDLLESILSRKATDAKAITHRFNSLPDNSIFSIDPAVLNKFPTASVGIAIIKGATITKEHAELAKRIEKFVHSQENLTNEIISSFSEVKSYRKLYKEMGIDWHSRRPSPEALLRRLATKKGLYKINSCVDAYNLIVMKNRVSVGAFDLDQIKFPTVLRFAKDGEQILLLGDKEPTTYTSKELAYFDQIGGYNIDFNYRDAQRTAVSDMTKNIYLNVDGIYDIDRTHVEKTLQESIDIIREYCGGTVEVAGIVSA